MTRPVVRIGGNGTAPGRRLWMWCPGCEDAHCITFGTPGWTWDGNEATPTIAPSIKVTGVQWEYDEKFSRPGHVSVPTGGETTCHSFVRAGRWEFLSDCTHTLAGQTVPMVPLPDWLTDEYVGPPEHGRRAAVSDCVEGCDAVIEWRCDALDDSGQVSRSLFACGDFEDLGQQIARCLRSFGVVSVNVMEWICDSSIAEPEGEQQ